MKKRHPISSASYPPSPELPSRPPRISRDGRGRATDNAFIEHLWRAVKWECVYLNPATDDQHRYQQLHAYFSYYNHHRPHQALKGQTPAQVFAQTPTFNPLSICLTDPA